MLVIAVIAVAYAITGNEKNKKVGHEDHAEEKGCHEIYYKCLDNRDMVEHYYGMTKAKVACKMKVEDSVRYGKPSWGWASFDAFIAGDDYPKTGVVKLMDDKVGIQNAFGGTINSKVICSYDFNKQTATIDRISER